MVVDLLIDSRSYFKDVYDNAITSSCLSNTKVRAGTRLNAKSFSFGNDELYHRLSHDTLYSDLKTNSLLI